jgi:hypothetical protein
MRIIGLIAIHRLREDVEDRREDMMPGEPSWATTGAGSGASGH